MAGASQTGTDKHQSDHTRDVLSFCGVLRQPQLSFHAPKQLEFRICPDVSANTPAKQFRVISPNPWSGTTSPVDVTVTGERHSTAWGRDPACSLRAAPAAGVFLTSKAGTERFLRASALLFVFSNAHKLSTNNLSYQVGEEDWVIMFVVQNEGCQF